MKSNINKILIRNLFTIRYNPVESPLIPPVQINDFQKNNSDKNGSKTLKLLKKSMIQHMKHTTGPFVVSLSGGIDSSLSLGLLRDSFPDADIFALCGVFEGSFDESLIAKKIAKKFDAKFKILKMGSIFANMPEIISISQKPKWNTYTHIVSKEAKKYGNTIVTGDGADEIFGGYTFRYSKFENLTFNKDNWKQRTLNYLDCHNRDWVPDQDKMFGTKIKFNWNDIHEYFKPYFKNNLKPLQQVMLADFNGKLLHDFIPSNYAISKKYDVSIVSPFINNDVIKFGLSLPLSQKFDTSTKKGKLILRKLTHKFGISHIDEKRGFSPSLWFDWKKHGKKICEKYILQNDSHVFKNNLINQNWVLTSFEKVNDDGDIRYLNRLVSILALEIWYRIFFTNEINPRKRLS